MYDDFVELQDEQKPPRVVGAFRVSARGQLSLPADVRRRWGLERGGPVEVVDLGHSVLLIPGEGGSLWRRIGEVLTADAYQEFVDNIDDPDLRNE